MQDLEYKVDSLACSHPFIHRNCTHCTHCAQLIS